MSVTNFGHGSNRRLDKLSSQREIVLMLSKHRCPHTGIVNYFARTEPFFAVGSISETERRPGHYYWRVYNAAKIISGIAADMKSRNNGSNASTGISLGCNSCSWSTRWFLRPEPVRMLRLRRGPA